MWTGTVVNFLLISLLLFVPCGCLTSSLAPIPYSQVMFVFPFPTSQILLSFVFCVHYYSSLSAWYLRHADGKSFNPLNFFYLILVRSWWDLYSFTDFPGQSLCVFLHIFVSSSFSLKISIFLIVLLKSVLSSISFFMFLPSWLEGWFSTPLPLQQRGQCDLCWAWPF